MKPTKVTRGKGLLESFLAKERARKANQLIPQELRSGKILDIGCGSYPYFLSHTFFKEKFAIENAPNSSAVKGINWYSIDLNCSPVLPFADGSFSTITLLAVIEHLNPTCLVDLFEECHRVLADDGVMILTTPAAWSDSILKFMARVSLVSHEEIKEHVYAYTLPLIGWYFGKAGFEMERIKFGYFELFLNMWAIAKK